jgi:hypothetical protein
MKMTDLICVAALFASLSASANNCYTIQNNTGHNIVLSFKYNSAIGEGMPIGATVFPHQTYPLAGGPWCFNTPPAFHATVTFAGGGKASWAGALVVGSGGAGVNPGGNYTIN